jgi:MFS family permease
MKTRIKWMLVGIGFTFGLQVIISLVFTGIALTAARSQTGFPQDTATLAAFGLTLGAFLVGGFVIGWMSAQQRILDAIAAAIITLVLNTLVYAVLPMNNKAYFVAGAWLSDRTGQITFSGGGVLFLVLTLAAAAVGAYWGWHTVVPTEGTLDRIALLLGLIGAVIGPFVILATGGRDPSDPTRPGLPTHFLAIAFLLLVVIIGIGFLLFTREAERESHYEEEISISPERRRQHR